MPIEEPTDEVRPRGRPRRDIDLDAVADAVAELFAQGGISAVSVADTAEKLDVSRATLYRTLPTKEDLIGVLFTRSSRDLTELTKEVQRRESDPGIQLTELIKLQSDAATRMGNYMPVFFGWGGLPEGASARWHNWSRRYEKLWATTVADCMAAGYLERGDPVVATRLILGMIIWVCRWYRPKEGITPDEIACEATKLLGLKSGATAAKPRKAVPRRR